MDADQTIIDFFLSKNHSSQKTNNGTVNDHPHPKISHTYLFNHLLILILLS